MHLVLGSYDGSLVGLQIAAAQVRSSSKVAVLRRFLLFTKIGIRCKQNDSLVSRRRFAYTPHSRFAATLLSAIDGADQPRGS